MSVLIWAGVVLIGGAGSVARFLADGAVAAALTSTVPAVIFRSARWSSTYPAR